MQVPQINSLDHYFQLFGSYHAKKAGEILDPLHVPGRDPTPDFSDMERQPFPAQSHVVAAAIKMTDRLSRGIISAQMGTGKTTMSMLQIHKHAIRSRRQGGYNGNYRVICLFPDHLGSKWREEILATIPDAKVFLFGEQGEGCKALLKDCGDIWRSLSNGTSRWTSPNGPEWYLIGRDAAKLMPSTTGSCHVQKGKHRGKPYWDPTVKELVYPRDLYLCPRCGEVVKDKNGSPINPLTSSKRLRCSTKMMVEIMEGGSNQVSETSLLEGKDTGLLPGMIRERDGRKWRVTECGEPLWQYVAKPKRWAPAVFINKKLRRAFQYMIVDEVHEQKARNTAQANAMGKIMSGCPNVLALTGTLIGGYAHNLFYLLFRFDARPLLDEGFTWSSAMAFTKKYGRIETTVTIRTDPEGRVTVSKGRCQSMRKEEDEKTSERPAPGIMPALFGNHLIDRSIFLSLEDMSEALPTMREYVGGQPDSSYSSEDRQFWVDCRVEMSRDQAVEYRSLEGILAAKCREMLIKGDMRLLGSMLSCLLGWQDRPWDWHPPEDIDQSLQAIGYRQDGGWIEVVQPRSLPQSVIYPKEKALLEIVKNEHEAGNGVWVYAVMTDKRDVQVRLKMLIERELGLRVSILRSKSVAPKERLAWIAKNGPKSDVIISHPQLVCTGVDFFAKDKSYNFPAICFYQCGFNLFTLRQASARAWRLLQWKGCRTYYLHYADTMQQKAMMLMARKMAAATQLDGELNVEGLTAISDEGSSAIALARSISENIDEKDILRHWAKIGTPAKPSALEEMGLSSLGTQELDAIDNLPIQLAIAAETILDHDPRFGRDKLASLFEDFGLTADDMALLEAF